MQNERIEVIYFLKCVPCFGEQNSSIYCDEIDFSKICANENNQQSDINW